MSPHALMILTCVFLVAPDTPQVDLGKLQGTWSLVIAVRDGREISDAEVAGSELVIKGETFTFLRDATAGTGPSGTFRIDPTKAPKAIDATPGTGPDAGKTWLGIYELDGDLYHVCFAPPGRVRPLRFVSASGSGTLHSVWKRGKSPVGIVPDEIQGTWELELVVANGRELENPQIKGAKFVAAPGRYTVTIGEQTIYVTYQLDRGASPPAIDLTYQDETGEGRTFKAIYRREGDRLLICRAQSPEGERPREFAAPADSGRVLIVLKRGRP